MSDPMTNIQIEDVLSSIRRLVAEGEKLRVAKAETPPEPVQDKPESRGRLVLTPALRVKNDRVATSGAPESDGVTRRKAGALDDAPKVQAGSASEEKMAGANVDMPKPANGPRDPSVAASAVDKDTSVLRLNVRSDIAANITPEPIAPSPLSAPHKPRLHLSPVDRVKEGDTTKARDFDRDRLSADRRPLRDIEDQSELAEDLGDELDAETKAQYLSDDEIIASAGLDEAMLRAMVINIIREELQGAWGEKITRNVRKLVRREINRVLSSQEFD